MSLDKENNKHRGYTEDSKLNTGDDSLEGRWSNIQADYRKKNPTITDDDVDSKKRNFDQMIASIARRTNRSTTEIEKEIRDWDS
ncbi:hypothetical protein [Gelidibacter gilvus]|uniref:General stress protein CsbD n=1 Tax=Gelidibacter gilvus TaxID=59602 RepID=A0A4V1LMT4_9FLAO|nr:hypothetical protein [Gelidibacter gilvus]RXJ49606.1 hypothetical protein ESZ48_11395 [Gelidibacter gilvus]